MDGQTLTFGQKAVGASFNPSQNPEVDATKEAFAKEIDRLNDLREVCEDPDKKRLCSVAITEIQTAQMWAVKAITWNP